MCKFKGVFEEMECRRSLEESSRINILRRLEMEEDVRWRADANSCSLLKATLH